MKIAELLPLKNTDLNGLRKNIYLRKPEVSVERNSVCNVIEELMGHGVHCLTCSLSYNVIDILPWQHFDVKVTLLRCYSKHTKHNIQQFHSCYGNRSMMTGVGAW